MTAAYIVTSLFFTGTLAAWWDSGRHMRRAERAAKRAEAAARAAVEEQREEPDFVDQYTDPRIIGNDH